MLPQSALLSGWHVLALIASSLLAPSSSGQQFGQAQKISSEGDTAKSVFAADIDGDGDVDLLTGKTNICWFENIDGEGTFGTQQLIHNAPDVRSVFGADLDGDGDIDAITASQVVGKIMWFENLDGMGSFGSERVVAYQVTGACAVHAADLDGDGDMDVVAAMRTSDAVSWFENTDGQGTFGPEQILSSAMDGASSVCASDLDGDGDLDVLAGAEDGDQIVWFENWLGWGVFFPPKIVTTAADGVSSVNASDLDGDGDMDVVAALNQSNEIAWFSNTDGLGSFGAPVPIGRGTGPRSVVASDLDGDGDPDVICAWEQAGQVAWYENVDGLGGFAHSQDLAAPGQAAGARMVWAADLDGDGDADAISVSNTDNKVAWYENTDGSGTFGSQLVLTTLVEEPGRVFAADLDGDGDMDGLARQGPATVAWYRNTSGQGSFGAAAPITTTAVGASPPARADLDGDGDLDVLLAIRALGKLVWHENVDGMGAFGPEQVIAALDARLAVPFDYDADGDPDIAVYYWNELSLLEHFGGKANYGTPQVFQPNVSELWSLEATDLDGDSDADLLAVIAVVSGGVGSDKIEWLENTGGPGIYGPPATIGGAGSGPRCAVAADIDGDGMRDVLASMSSISEVQWFENLQSPLAADVETLTLTSGGTQNLTLVAGFDQQLRVYVLLGSLSGTSGGLQLNGLVLPLTPDAYFVYTLTNPNGPPLTGSLGTLSSEGTASAAFVLPPGLNPALAGITFHHAYAVVDTTAIPGSPVVSFVSNAVPLNLLP